MFGGPSFRPRPGPGLRILALTIIDRDEYVYEEMRAGASGFLLKSAQPQQLVEAVRSVVAGDALLAPEITHRLLAECLRRPPLGTERRPGLGELTRREIEVLELIAAGLSNAEIAARLVETGSCGPAPVDLVVGATRAANRSRRRRRRARTTDALDPGSALLTDARVFTFTECTPV